MMKVLLEAGGDKVVNIKNTAGKTAREIFEDTWIERTRGTLFGIKDVYFRKFGGRGRQKSPLYPPATSVNRGR